MSGVHLGWQPGLARGTYNWLVDVGRRGGLYRAALSTARSDGVAPFVQLTVFARISNYRSRKQV